jgi:hypothetical protein
MENLYMNKQMIYQKYLTINLFSCLFKLEEIYKFFDSISMNEFDIF